MRIIFRHTPLIYEHSHYDITIKYHSCCAVVSMLKIFFTIGINILFLLFYFNEAGVMRDNVLKCCSCLLLSSA